MVFICNTLGLHAPALFPKKTGTNYELTDYLSIIKAHRKDFTLFSGDGMNLLPSWLPDSRHVVWMKAQQGKKNQDPVSNSQIHILDTG